MRILALDLSSVNIGWYVSKRQAGVIRIDKKLDFPHKLSKIRYELLEIIRKIKPDVVVLEDTYLRYRNVSTLKQLARVSGVALEACASGGIPVELITATDARKRCCGKAHTKEDIFKYFVEKHNFNTICQRLWGTDCNFEIANDLTDAAAVHFGYKELLTDGEKKVTKKEKRKHTPRK